MSVFSGLMLLLTFSVLTSSIIAATSLELEKEMVPQMEDGLRMRMILDLSESSRRKLRNFQMCSVCTCCGGAHRICVASPCCYSINCNIPNRPFGFCSFSPKTCNCFGCHG